RYRRARALSENSVGTRPILVNDDVVLGALPIDQIDLNSLSFMYHQQRIDLAIYFATDADVDHSSVGNTGAEREAGRRVHVTHCCRCLRRSGLGRRLLRGPLSQI